VNNSLDKDYLSLGRMLLLNGNKKTNRTGVNTKSLFGFMINFDMKEGFPLLTTKKVYWKGVVEELKWFLRGDTNIKYLVDNGCNIWNGDAYRNYCMNQVPHDHFETEEEFIELIKTNDKFAEKWGELGPIYGYNGETNQDMEYKKIRLNFLWKVFGTLLIAVGILLIAGMLWSLMTWFYHLAIMPSNVM